MVQREVAHEEGYVYAATEPSSLDLPHRAVQVEFARREFILAAMHENGGTVGSLSECRQVCKTLWGLELDIDEIRGVLHRLIAAAKVEAHGATYQLSPEGQKELAGRVRDSSETEAEAFAEWEVGIRDVQPDLSNEEVSLLQEDLDAWLQRIIAQHGVEAAMLLYPEEERGQQILADIQALGFSFLPERGEALAAVRPKALLRLHSCPERRAAGLPRQPDDHGVHGRRLHPRPRGT